MGGGIDVLVEGDTGMRGLGLVVGWAGEGFVQTSV